MKEYVAAAAQIAAGYLERCTTSVDEMQLADSRRDYHGPPSAATPNVRAHRIRRQSVPREHPKVVEKNPSPGIVVNTSLIES
jgi:hypothetical protein